MKKSYLVFGAGAIGTYIGASLTLQGHQVVFLEKEGAIPTLERRGLQMAVGGTKYQLTEAEFTDKLDILLERHFDLAILALKTYHLDGIIPKLADLKDDLPPLLCLQNGVDSEIKLAEALGKRAVIPGTVTSSVDRLEKGVIILRKSRGMGIAGEHPLVREFQAAFNQAGLKCRYYRHPEVMKWSKLVINLLGNASSAILNLPPSSIYSHPGLYQMELDQIRECLAVMKRLRIQPANLPGVPVKLLAGIVRWLPASLSQPILSGIIGGGRGEKMPSFHIDLYSGKGTSEVEDLNGAVVRGGKDVGVPTPVNHFLTSRLMGLITGEIPLIKYHDRPNLFLKELRAYQNEGFLNG